LVCGVWFVAVFSPCGTKLENIEGAIRGNLVADSGRYSRNQTK
jgi:hypothetical protein